MYIYCAYSFRNCSLSALVVHAVFKCGICFTNVSAQVHSASNTIELKDLSLETLFCFVLS